MDRAWHSEGRCSVTDFEGSKICDIADLLRRCSFRWSSEADIHKGAIQWLEQHHQSLPTFRSEVRLSARDRLDVLLGDGTAIEIKVDGSRTAVLRQLHRYAEHDAVSGLILLTTKSSHSRQMPKAVLGKPLEIVQVLGL